MAARALKRKADGALRSAPLVEYAGYIEPCRATNAGRAPAGAGWAHEIKYDGFRSQVHLREKQVTIYSSGQHDWTERFVRLPKMLRSSMPSAR